MASDAGDTALVVSCDDGLDDRGRTLLGGDMNSGGIAAAADAVALAPADGCSRAAAEEDVVVVVVVDDPVAVALSLGCCCCGPG